MHELAYLIAAYRLGVDYHSGQWSKGYRLQCQAEERLSRSQINPGRTWEQLDARTVYPRGAGFRNAVALWLKRMRHSRHTL